MKIGKFLPWKGSGRAVPDIDLSDAIAYTDEEVRVITLADAGKEPDEGETNYVRG